MEKRKWKGEERGKEVRDGGYEVEKNTKETKRKLAGAEREFKKEAWGLEERGEEGR